MKQILETSRLLLREMHLDDLDFVAEMLGDAEVMRHYPRCYSREESKAWIRRQMDRYFRRGYGLWLVVEKASDRPVGQVGLVPQRVNGKAKLEVGYLIHRPFWRRGFATEAASAVRDHAFDVLGKRTVISLIRPENLPSQGVAHKLGMKPIATTLHAGLDHIVFAVSREGRAPRRDGLFRKRAASGDVRPGRRPSGQGP